MWKTIMCAVQGRGHEREEIPCQDKTFSYAEDGVYVVALADGAGSARLSHEGAAAVTADICRDIAEHFDEYFAQDDGVMVKKQLMANITDCLKKKAEALECDTKDLASTLLAAAVKEDRFFLVHIGDGVIGYLKEDVLKIASQPENGEFANTTVFTTSKEALMGMRLIKGTLGTIDGFVLMSDGSEAGLYHKQEKRLSDGLKKVMQMAMMIPEDAIEAMLYQSFQQVIRQATQDDCSIAVLVRDDRFDGFHHLNAAQKHTLLQLRGTNHEKRVRRYDDLLSLLTEGKTLRQLSRAVHVKPRYLKKHLVHLCGLHMIEKSGDRYQTQIFMG